jgi:hypothetical protein
LPFPLLLSQLVTVLTYCQLLVTVVAQQNSYKDGESVFFFPIFTCLEALVYIGALRVGQIYTNPLGADDDDYEVVSFFNRNLKLAGLYGCYGLGGGGGGEEEGAGGDEDFDFRSNAPPMTDLRAAQETVLRRVPVEVYAHEHSRTGVDDDFAEGVPPREGAEIPSTPQLRLSVAARKKMKESEEPVRARARARAGRGERESAPTTHANDRREQPTRAPDGKRPINSFSCASGAGGRSWRAPD